jgi:hypothetical protein
MTTHQRQHARALMDQFMAHAAQMLYPPGDQRNGTEAYDWSLTEAQLTTLLLNKHQLEFDCSDSSSWIYTAIGAWPKSRGPGYTGTWLSLGLSRYTDGKIAQVAAPVIFGINTKPDGHHMGLVHTPDPKNGNPVISEHGSSGWRFTPLHDVIARQTAEGYPGYTFLNVSRL